jgi:hypothetical protein
MEKNNRNNNDTLMYPLQITLYNRTKGPIGIWCKEKNHHFLPKKTIKNETYGTFEPSSPEHTYIRLNKNQKCIIELPAGSQKKLFPLRITAFDFKEEIPTDNSITQLKVSFKRSSHFKIINTTMKNKRLQFFCLKSPYQLQEIDSDDE